MGRSFLARFDQQNVVIEDAENNYFVRQDNLEGCPVIVTKYQAEQLTEEKVIEWANDPAAIVSKMNNRMTSTKVGDEGDDDMTYHFHVETPTIAVSNRSLFLTYYVEKDSDTGTVSILSSSKGTENLIESQAELVGRNVIAELTVSYLRLEPISTGGYNIEQVSCFDPKGWIPGFINQIGVTKSASIVRDTVEYLMTGKEPEPLF